MVGDGRATVARLKEKTRASFAHRNVLIFCLLNAPLTFLYLLYFRVYHCVH